LHRTWGPSLVDDLHIGGVIMWVGGDTLMLWPMIPLAVRWMHLEERRAVRVDREFDQAAAAAEAQLTSELHVPAE
jgi:putative copper resistance protein D